MSEHLPEDPIKLFQDWLKEAENSEMNDPNAMCLATTDSSGKPSARMVLLKSCDENGFVFYTNSQSHKGRDLSENAEASLCFYWKSTRKQVRVEGKIEMVSAAEADTYFTSRPRGSKIGAWASAQSRPLESREQLEDNVRNIEKKYKGRDDIPRPAYWNGYRLKPEMIEFWIADIDRLHHRFEYRREKDGKWFSGWLYP